MSLNIRTSTLDDASSIYQLYRTVAALPGGIARLEHEVSIDYINDFLTKAASRGLSLVAEQDGNVVGEIHAYSPGLFCFAHIWSDLTIAVPPNQQGQGTGRTLFEALMHEIKEDTRIKRVELIARESNERAILFYESLGFIKEGYFNRRIQNLDGTFEADIPMAWQRPPA